MSPLHLIWVLPITFFIGFMTAALLSSGSRADELSEYTRRIHDLQCEVNNLSQNINQLLGGKADER